MEPIIMLDKYDVEGDYVVVFSKIRVEEVIKDLTNFANHLFVFIVLFDWLSD
jgi:hypothetical protein